MSDYDNILHKINTANREIEEFEYSIKTCRDIISELRTQLPHLYYVMPLDKRMTFSGTQDECAEYVVWRGFEYSQLLPNFKTQYFPRGQLSGQVSGWIKYATPLDNIWQEVLALSKVRS